MKNNDSNRVRRVARVLGMTALLLAAGATVQAQNYSLAGSSFGSGSGTATGGNHTVRARIGQPFVGVYTNGTYTVVTGAGMVATVVQTPDAPTLEIIPDGTTMILTWELTEEDFVLQETRALGPAERWSLVEGRYQTTATHMTVRVPVMAGNRMFRLEKR